MTRFILTMGFILSLSIGQALAADDGGFGSSRFSATAPAALGGPSVSNGQTLATGPENPSDIEPAAGDEEDITAPEEPLNDESHLQNSSHSEEPYIIQKDMIAR